MAREEDIKNAVWHMHCKTHTEEHHWALEEQPRKPAGHVAEMTAEDVLAYIEQNEHQVVLLIDGRVVDATSYLEDHVRRSR